MPGDSSHDADGDRVLQVAGHGLLRPSSRVDGKGISKPTYLDELIFYSLLHYASLPTSPPILQPFGSLLPHVPTVRDMWFTASSSSPEEGSGYSVDNLLPVLIRGGGGSVKEVASDKTCADDDVDAQVPQLVAKYFDAARLAACKAAYVQPTSPAALKDGCWYVDMLNEVAGMEAPCVIDIKVGKLRSSPSAGASGERKEIKDNGTTAKSIGLRLSGVRHMMDVSKSSGGLVETTIGMDKTFGRALTETTFATMLSVFCTTSVTNPASLSPLPATEVPPISTSPSCLFEYLTRMGTTEKAEGSGAYIQQVCTTHLKGLVSILRSSPTIMASICVLSSSVMIAYDCAEVINKNPSPSSSSRPAVVVKLIDFARSGPRGEHFPEVDGVDFVNSLERLANLLDTA